MSGVSGNEAPKSSETSHITLRKRKANPEEKPHASPAQSDKKRAQKKSSLKKSEDSEKRSSRRKSSSSQKSKSGKKSKESVKAAEGNKENPGQAPVHTKTTEENLDEMAEEFEDKKGAEEKEKEKAPLEEDKMAVDAKEEKARKSADAVDEMDAAPKDAIRRQSV